MSDSENNIFFIGAGHGGLHALRSLMACFQSITVLSDDSDILALLRKQDRHVQKLEDVGEKYGVLAGSKEILDRGFLENRFVLNVHYPCCRHIGGCTL